MFSGVSEVRAVSLFLFLVDGIFDPKNGDNLFFQNIGVILPD
jgi:hypothetical protein